MRYTVWQRDDYFSSTDPENEGAFVRIYMDSAAVTLPSEAIAVTLDFQVDGPPVGKMFDLAIDEEGNITGEVEWFANSNMDDDKMEEQGLVFGGYYTGVKKENPDGSISSADLRAVSVVHHNSIPSRGEPS